MSPKKHSEKRMGIIPPPVLEADKNILVWRNKIAIWVDLIANSAQKR